MPIGMKGFQKGNQASKNRLGKKQKAPIVRERLIAELYKRDLSKVSTVELLGFFKVIQPKDISVAVAPSITYVSSCPRPEVIDATASALPSQSNTVLESTSDTISESTSSTDVQHGSNGATVGQGSTIDVSPISAYAPAIDVVSDVARSEE